MKTLKNKIAAITIAIFLMFSMTASTMLIPTTNAHYVNVNPPNLPASWQFTSQYEIPTYAYLSVSPNPDQVGRYLSIVMWLNCIAPTSGGEGGDRWYNWTVAVTRPDGTKETLGPYASSQVGAQSAEYTPTQIGNYTFVFSWPGQILTNGTGVPNVSGVPWVGDHFEGSTSDPVTVVVQQNAITEWVPVPLPTGYWQLPINAQNREWGAAIASNSLGGTWLVNNFQSEGKAPNSAHILWQTPVADTPGGILDARWPQHRNQRSRLRKPICGADNHERHNLLQHTTSLNDPPLWLLRRGSVHGKTTMVQQRYHYTVYLIG